MRAGMNSEKFFKRAEWLWKKFCRMLHETFDGATRQEQQEEKHGWTIRPEVDGCRETEDDIEPPK